MTAGFLSGLSWGDPDANVIHVGTGEFAVAEHPAILMTPALGSCVGVAVWDAFRHRGGLAHVMLPTPSEANADGNRDRFAAIAIPRMIEEVAGGAAPRRLVAKIVGGAAMFKADSNLSNVGERNLEEVRHQLGLLRIPILAEDTGGSHARTVELRLDTGVLVVRSYMYGIREL
ncbi:MAG: chemotaxis protein CheD [Actinobacteria bacterium HGW-Actinobacteria-1]|jgi:chemotaxis protein CheD|nr:MAG: chemotaxis protein CheD [Actinobacteria bacterium HGW-Actinobacteria-1]